MLKTNSKKAKENIMNYIRTASAEYYIEDCGAPEDITDNELCGLILDDFRTTWSGELKRNAYRQKPLTYQELFEDWGCGLTAGDLFDFFNYGGSAVETLGDILEETEEERSKYTEEKAEKWLCYLIYREVSNGAQKAGIRLP